MSINQSINTSIGRHYAVKEIAKFIEEPGVDDSSERLKANATKRTLDNAGFVPEFVADLHSVVCQTLSDLQAAGYPAPCPPEYKALLSLFSFSQVTNSGPSVSLRLSSEILSDK